MAEVEERSITDYRLMLFTAINTAMLDSGMGGFQYMTEDEEMSEFEHQIEHYRSMGVFK